METIKNYLENMFMHLPNTPEVQKAKDELLQMMEDKYTELIEDGKTENEAVGTVISEFGNLSELAEALGIESIVNPQQFGAEGQPQQDIPPMNRRMVTMDEALNYLHVNTASTFKVALGVLIILLGLAATVMLDSLIVSYDIGGVVFIVSVAIAVALFIVAGTRLGKYDYLKKTPCSIDYATSKTVENEKKQNEDSLVVMRTVGIVLCILSFVPAAILDEFNPKFFRFTADDLGGALLLVCVGIGVFMIVYSCNKLKGYRILLTLNDANTMSGGYVGNAGNNRPGSQSPFVKEIYWPTITCIYLCWSFLTFDWHISWVIWPIAAIAGTIINQITKKEE